MDGPITAASAVPGKRLRVPIATTARKIFFITISLSEKLLSGMEKTNRCDVEY